MTVTGNIAQIKKFNETEPKQLEKEMRKFLLTNSPGQLVTVIYIGDNTFVFFFIGDV